MKKALILLAMCFTLTLSAGDTKDVDKVWICASSGAKTYHKTKACSGLNNCKAAKKEITLKEAEKMGRRPCKICYKETNK